MKKESVRKFLSALAIHDPEENGTWLRGQCPLAFATHKTGKDSRPSFAVNMETGGFHCFTCRSGRLSALLQEIEMHLPNFPHYEGRFNLKLAWELLEGLESEIESLPEFQEFSPKSKAFIEWPEWFLEQFVPWDQNPRGKWYLETGRVTINESQPVDPQVATAMELHYDAKKDMIVAPFRTMGGKLAGARGRALDKAQKYGHHDYSWGPDKVNNTELIWYNERALESSMDAGLPLVVVEGQFDCLNVLRVYPHCVAGLTAKASVEKLTKLQSVDAVLTMLDHDKTGEESYSHFSKYLYKKTRLGRLMYPESAKDPGKLTLEMLQETFKEILNPG